jgi:hypothetical protein
MRTESRPSGAVPAPRLHRVDGGRCRVGDWNNDDNHLSRTVVHDSFRERSAVANPGRCPGRMPLGPVDPIPCPRIAQATEAAKQNCVAARSIECEPRILAGRWRIGRGLLCPIGAVPRPRVVQPRAVEAAEQQYQMTDRVVGHRGAGPRGRAVSGTDLVPGPVPQPCIAAIVAGLVAAEHHDHAMLGVVCKGGALAGRRHGGGLFSNPLAAVPRPGVVADGGAEPAEEDDLRPRRVVSDIHRPRPEGRADQARGRWARGRGWRGGGGWGGGRRCGRGGDGQRRRRGGRHREWLIGAARRAQENQAEEGDPVQLFLRLCSIWTPWLRVAWMGQ